MAEGKPPALEPVPGSPSETQAWYDRVSGLYAGFIEDLEFPPTAEAIQGLAIGPEDTVLDLGCGAGRGMLAVADQLGRDGTVVGVDFASGMCRETRESIEDAGVSTTAGIVCGDVTDLPIETDAADAAVCSFVLDLLSTRDIDAALDEIARVLRPGGQLAVVSLAHGETVATTIYRSLRRLFPTQLDCRPIPTAKLLDDGEFEVIRTRELSLYGLPVSISYARNAAPDGTG